MKIRLVEEYNPVTEKTWFMTERLDLTGWWYVAGTIECNEDLARARWDRLKANGLKLTKITKRVLDHATI